MEKVVLIGSDMLLLRSISERLPNVEVECLSYEEAKERGFTNATEINEPLDLSPLELPKKRVYDYDTRIADPSAPGGYVMINGPAPH